MKKQLVAAFLVVLSGCGSEQATKTRPPAETQEATAKATAEAIQLRDLAPLKIGPYEVQPKYEGQIEDGHYSIDISGGEVAAVRIWVGPEDASGVMVVKTEIENNYHHGHVEMSSPVTADAKLWIEIETPDGEKLEGSTPLPGV